MYIFIIFMIYLHLGPEHFDRNSIFLSIHFPSVDFQGLLLFVSESVLLKQFSCCLVKGLVWFSLFENPHNDGCFFKLPS